MRGEGGVAGRAGEEDEREKAKVTAAAADM